MREAALKAAGFLTLLLAPLGSQAYYNANLVGVVTQVLTYPESGHILFVLNNQPSHPACNSSYFAFGDAGSEAAVNRVYARLLVAHATGEPVNIGFDNEGNCASGYIRAHRVG
jgi:hypothetical protein